MILEKVPLILVVCLMGSGRRQSSSSVGELPSPPCAWLRQHGRPPCGDGGGPGRRAEGDILAGRFCASSSSNMLLENARAVWVGCLCPPAPLPLLPLRLGLPEREGCASRAWASFGCSPAGQRVSTHLSTAASKGLSRSHLEAPPWRCGSALRNAPTPRVEAGVPDVWRADGAAGLLPSGSCARAAVGGGGAPWFLLVCIGGAAAASSSPRGVGWSLLGAASASLLGLCAREAGLCGSVSGGERGIVRSRLADGYAIGGREDRKL